MLAQIYALLVLCVVYETLDLDCSGCGSKYAGVRKSAKSRSGRL